VAYVHIVLILMYRRASLREAKSMWPTTSMPAVRIKFRISLNALVARSFKATLAKVQCLGELPCHTSLLQSVDQPLIFSDQLGASLSSATLDFKHPLHQFSEVFHGISRAR
jgi:hypothetical protein